MAPGHLLGVVGRAVRGTAVRAGEAAASAEVDMDVETVCLGVELATGHAPGRGQCQRKLQQVGVSHGRISAVAPTWPRLAPCSPPPGSSPGAGYRTLRAACGGGLRPSLTAA